jgi:hypothetical protein
MRAFSLKTVSDPGLFLTLHGFFTKYGFDGYRAAQGRSATIRAEAPIIAWERVSYEARRQRRRLA